MFTAISVLSSTGQGSGLHGEGDTGRLDLTLHVPEGGLMVLNSGNEAVACSGIFCSSLLHFRRLFFCFSLLYVFLPLLLFSPLFFFCSFSPLSLFVPPSGPCHDH